MKDQKNLIVLYKDHTIQIQSPDKFKYHKSMKYILSPELSYRTNGFMMLKPNEYMNFTKANIKVTLQYRWYDYGNDEYYSSTFNKMNKDYNNLIDFYDALHSLYRMYYVDFIMSTASNYETFNMVDLKEIEITLYDKKEVSYHKHIDYSNNTKITKDSSELLLLQMLMKIEDIFDLRDEELKTHKLLVMDYQNMMWDIRSDIHNSKLIYGMRLFRTRTIYFMEDNIISCLDNIGKALIDEKVIDVTHDYSVKNFQFIKEEEVNDFDVYEDYIYHIDFSYNDIIEYILYLPMVYLNILLIYSKFIFEDTDLNFDIITHIVIENSYTGKNAYLLFNKDKLPTIVDFFRAIIEAWGESNR